MAVIAKTEIRAAERRFVYIDLSLSFFTGIKLLISLKSDWASKPIPSHTLLRLRRTGTAFRKRFQNTRERKNDISGPMRADLVQNSKVFHVVFTVYSYVVFPFNPHISMLHTDDGRFGRGLRHGQLDCSAFRRSYSVCS